jgi:hypothetical protein
MASQTKTKLYKVESKPKKTGVKTYRHSIFLEKALLRIVYLLSNLTKNLIVGIDQDILIVTKLKD